MITGHNAAVNSSVTLLSGGLYCSHNTSLNLEHYLLYSDSITY